MNIRGATTVLKRECEFLGLSMQELLICIQRNPYAFPNRTIEAYNAYQGVSQ